MLRIAMLSKWHVHAGEYADAALKTGKVEITYMWDEDRSRGEEWAKQLGAYFEPDINMLLKRDDIDAVIVDTPTAMHHEVLVKAANSSKHIFTEKALAPTVSECEEISTAVKKAGITFVISFPQRSWPVVKLAKSLIEDGEFGKISRARIRNGHNGVSGKWLPEYWFDLSSAAGGALMDLGCHPMYLASFLFGRPKRINAMMTAPFGGIADMDENASATIEFEGGEIVTGETSFISFASPNIIEIYGTDATFIAIGDDAKLKSKNTARYSDDFIKLKLPAPSDHPIVQFVDACVSGSGSPKGFTVDDGVELTRLLENCYISNRENRTVSL